MIYKQHKNEFKDIGTIVYYTRNFSSSVSRPFPVRQYENNWKKEYLVPDIIRDSTCSKVLYRISDTKPTNIDFSEYNFDFIINKAKFNDKILLNYLTPESKNKIGIEAADLEKSSYSLFPTSIQTGVGDDSPIDYFGITRILNQTFYVLNVPENVIKIEFYEGSIKGNHDSVVDKAWDEYFSEGDKNFVDYDCLEVGAYLGDIKGSNIVTPVISVYLGPNYFDTNNSNSMYYPTGKEDVSEEFIQKTDHKTWQVLYDEARCSKVVWMLLSSDKSITEINLAYNSWINNDNPTRNKKNYSIRNDEYLSTRESLGNIEKLGSGNTILTFDAASGTLLGTNDETLSETRSLLMLKKKLARVKVGVFSPYVEYKEGDAVKYGKSEYISLIDHNLGNIPVLSYAWGERRETENDIFTQTINIFCNPPSVATINPGVVTIKKSNQLVEIEVVEEPGYGFDSCMTEINGEKFEKVNVSLTESSGNYVKKVSIADWDKIFNKGNSVIFNFNKIGVDVEFSGMYDKTNSKFDIKYQGIGISDQLVGDINLDSIQTGKGEDISISQQISGVIKVPTDKIVDGEVKYCISGLSNKFKITSIQQIYRLSGVDYTREMDWEKDANGKIIIKDPYILTYQSSEVLMNLTDRIEEVRLYPGHDLIETSIDSIRAPYSSSLVGNEIQFCFPSNYTLAHVDIYRIVNGSIDTGGSSLQLTGDNVILSSDSDNQRKEKFVKDSLDSGEEIVFELYKTGDIYTVAIKNLIRSYALNITTIDSM